MRRTQRERERAKPASLRRFRGEASLAWVILPAGIWLWQTRRQAAALHVAARRIFLELSWGGGGICNESCAGPSNRLR
jgi:hypothetical protein